MVVVRLEDHGHADVFQWENPRATAITYFMLVASIFAGRYLPILRWTFKTLYISLGRKFTSICGSSSDLTITAVISATELLGKLTVNQGIVSSFRPRKYLTIPRQSLENVLGDVEQLINFFVIELQRILFAENLMKTLAVSCVRRVEELGCSLSSGLYHGLGFLLSHQVPSALGSGSHWPHHHVFRPFDLHQQQGTHR